MNTEDLIKEVADKVKDLLIEKNRAYGNSALNPSNIFSQGDVFESLGSRIDDKLMRIKNKGINDETEDTVSDLIGYLILLKVAMLKEKIDTYESEKELIENGGHLNINGKPISTIEDLEYHYEEKKSKN